MIVYAKGISSLKEYEKDKARQEASPPAECPRCRLADVFWRHGSYLRQVKEWAEKAAVKIHRYICKECSLTLSCLYGFVVAHRRCSAKMVAEAIEGYATEPTSYREVAWSKEAEASSSSIYRWVRDICGKGKQLLFAVQREMVAGNLWQEEEPLAPACPNAEKAKSADKKEKLNDLAELVAKAASWLSMDKALLKLNDYMAVKAETCLSVLSIEARLSAPQRVKHLNF